MSIFDQFSKVTKDFGNKAQEMTKDIKGKLEEQQAISRLNAQVNEAKNQMKNTYMAIGERYYELHKDDVENDMANQFQIIADAMDADVFISLTHFKGHESTGFGGALKNIGMGCGSRAGKMHQHSQGKPVVNADLCRCCKRCAKECGSDAIFFDTGKAVIHEDICKGCGRCIGACSFDAIHNPNDNANEILGCKITEYTKAVVDGRPHFHISLILDVSPNCDCHPENDAAILPNIGMFASFDPVALDQACADACLKADPMPNSQLSDNLAKPDWHHHHDHFMDSNPNVRWKETLEHAEKIGLGNREYELIKF